jgi:16S rRNA (uracil1498-N3)-methyltransferase
MPRLAHRKVSIAISPLKNASRFEWFLEKATELGVAEIFPIICHRTVREHFRQERLQSICVSAMLQSQQAWLPRLHAPMPYEQFIATQSLENDLHYHHRWIAHCADLEKHHLVQTLKPGMEDSLLLIGPEGDFTPSEIVHAEANSFVAVSLGETRLRTETAGVVAASLLCLMP